MPKKKKYFGTGKSIFKYGSNGKPVYKYKSGAIRKHGKAIRKVRGGYSPTY